MFNDKTTVYILYIHYYWQTFKQIIKKPIFGLYRQLNGSNILMSMYRKVRENSWSRYLRLFSCTKGGVSVIKTSCAHSVTLKRINKTHLFLNFHIVIWTRELLSTRVAYQGYCYMNYGRNNVCMYVCTCANGCILSTEYIKIQPIVIVNKCQGKKKKCIR